ncbi:uncharacterized protein EI97DRAFT_208095 [Westerdykella ornata]|uniref:Uncharacterized protein n=1 Tax=Westerdykella ornata TaxID=318751 RepID=A0A6A6J7Y8_WESOR|nr:uncharacterized protein EI97DRAFT_208095 [Westerdykella ornata]KAF2272522.1 hypothetical protein EI97DRAFT_208095 [Westerdykella ornata]
MSFVLYYGCRVSYSFSALPSTMATQEPSTPTHQIAPPSHTPEAHFSMPECQESLFSTPPRVDGRRRPRPPRTTPHPRTLHTDRDVRLQVQTLHQFGHSLKEISRVLGITYRQAQYAHS